MTGKGEKNPDSKPKGGKSDAPTGKTGKRASRTSPAKARLGPSTALSLTEWVGTPEAKESFVFWVGGPTGGRQFTFHRPIGVSGIEDAERQWVATYTNEVEFLLKNSKPHDLVVWERKAKEAAEKHLLSVPGSGRRIVDGQIFWDDVPSMLCSEAVKQFMAAAKAAGKPEAEWLSFSPDNVQSAEKTWRLSKKGAKAPDSWLSDNPKPEVVTLGGPLGTVKQTPIPYLYGKSPAAAQDLVLKVALGLGSNEPSAPTPTVTNVTVVGPSASSLEEVD